MRETVGRLLRRATGAPLGWVVTAGGTALLVVGWYGVSGESDPARQLPYLASATIPGAALLIAGLLLAARTRGGEQDRQLLADLHAALLEPTPAVTEPDAGADQLWATERGGTYHRQGCPLAATAARVGADEIRARALTPCPVCDPPPVPAG
jgi:hypothetical protein